MKKLFFTFLISLSVLSYGQAPQEISYQGVARNVSGSLLANQNIGIKLDLHQGSAGGAIVFSETHTKTTNSFGLFTLGIGSVNTTSFAAINWANGPYFLEVSMDPAGGSSYSSVGTQQFMSVPYALYAKTAGNATTYTAGSGINVSGNTISNAAPDQTVVINAAGSATVNGTYPNFTISTPTTQVYSAGNGIDISGGVISNTAAAVTPTIVGTGATTVNGVYPNLTINTPTTQTYSAGNGIDITGGVISNTAVAVTPTIVGTGATTVNGVYPNLTINTPTVAPDLTVSLTGTGAATVNGTYPNFTVTVPNGTSLPTGFNGQFLFNNGTIWDTLPRPNLFFDGTNFGIGTTAPQANFHVVGAGRFDASVSTPQIYTDNIKITGGNAGQVLTSDAIGNGTWQAIPSPTLSYNNGTNVLTLTQGSIVTTATLNGTGSNTVSIVGSGLASVTPTTGSTFTVSVPNPTLSIASGSLSISNGNSVAIPSPSLTINSNSLTINGPGGNTVVLPTASTTSLTQGPNVTVSGSAPNYTVGAPAYSISIPGGNVVQITNGVSTSTSAINATSLTLTGTNNNILSAGGNTVALNTYTPGTGITMTGTAPNYTLSSPNQSLTINSNSLSITGGNTITLPTSSTTSLTPGTNVTVAGSAPSYTVSSVTPTLNVIGGSLAGSYPSQTLTIPTSSTTVLTQSTGISVLGSAPSYTLVNTAPAVTQTLIGTGISSVTAAANTFTVNTPMPIYTPTTGVLSFGGTNTVVATPSLSIVGNIIRSGPATNTITLPPAMVTGTGTGIATVTTAVNNFTVNVPSPTYTAATGVLSFGGTNTVVITPTLALTGTTLTSGAPTNSVNLSSLSVWSNSVGVLYPTTLTNSVGVGTSGPLTDKMEINHASLTGSTHLHLKQTGADAFSRIKFTNAVAPTKFWLSTVTSAATDANSGYNFFYNNGSIGHNIFTVGGDGLVSVNPFGTMNNARFYVGGKAKIDSTLSMAAYNTPPGVAAPNEGRIYFDRPSQKFKVSENGSPYVNLIGGGPSPWIQGPGIITQNNPGDLVGIGTVAPTSPLHIYGMADPLQITVENSGGAFKTGYHIKTATQEWFMGKETGGSAGLHFTDITNGQVRMAIETSGNVGIGTTSPNAMLDIQNSGNSYGGIQLNMNDVSNGSNGVQVLHQGLGNGGYFEIDNASSNAYAVQGKITNGTPSSSAVKGLNMSSSGNAGNFQIFNSSNSQSALIVTNDGLGQGGYFENTNVSNFSSAVYAQSNGGGSTISGYNSGAGGVADFAVTNATSNATAMHVINHGMGQVAFLENSNSSNGSNVLYVKNVGTNDAIMGEQWGTNGNTLRLSSGNGTNTSPTIFAQKSGPGAVAFFENINTTTNANAIAAVTYGTGSTIFGNNQGTAGHAGYFNIPGGSSNTDAALYAANVANGNAFEAQSGAGKAISASNASNTNAAIFATNSGTSDGIQTIAGAGRGLYVQNGSNSSAAAEITNNANSTSLYVYKNSNAGGVATFANLSGANGSDAVVISNSGSGNALNVTGKVKIADATQGLGKVLTSDAAGNASWQAPSGGALSGGITNRITKWTSATTVSNANIIDNGSITMNPTTSLPGVQINSNALNAHGGNLSLQSSVTATAVGNGLGSLYFGATGGMYDEAGIRGERDAASSGGTDLPSALVFYTTADNASTNTERMRITNAGNVGIGISAATAKLHAVNSASTSAAGRFENNSTANSSDAVFVTNAGTGTAIHAVNGPTVTGSSNVALWLESGHLKSTQATAPTTSSVSVSGITSVTPSISSGTDTKGTLTAVCTTTGNITPGNSVTVRVTFNKPYTVVPTVVATPTSDFGLISYFVNTVSTSSFNITIKNNSTASFPLTTFSFNYMVIE